MPDPQSRTVLSAMIMSPGVLISMPPPAHATTLFPVQLDDSFAALTPFKGRIAHAMYTGELISAATAMTLPGPGTIYLGQDLRFERPVRIGDTITVQLTVLEKTDEKKLVTLQTVASNQNGKVVVRGTASVMAPSQKLRIERPAAPKVSVSR